MRLKHYLRLIYCTITALPSKPLINNGAGEGNRTLVTGMVVDSGIKLHISLDSGAFVQ
jgi:hypothetical protein